MPTQQHILLVEDDPDQRALYTQVLSLAGYHITAVADGEAALQRLAQDPFDLVLSDWYLPGLNGVTLISTIRARLAPLKTILMSNQYDVRTAADACAADGCIRKGDIAVLRQTVDALLKQHA